MARLGPSGLAQLFREISTYVSKRLSDYSTKAELDSLLDAKADDNNVVHTSGDETIAGNKTFSNRISFPSGYYLTTDANDNSLRITRDGTNHGNNYKIIIQGDTGKIFAPNGFIGNLQGNADTATSANDPNAVHKTGNETINGVKSFNDMIKATNGTIQVGADTGYSVTFNYSRNIVSKQPSGTFNIFLPDANGTLAIDENVVHTSGDEHINGTKMFSNTIHRYADLTTLDGLQVYRFDDINANPCGHIYNNVHWHDNAVFNRHGAYNAKSGKSMEIDITSNDSGVGMAYVAGTATKGNLETVTSATGHTGIATMGWVNNPATSTNVVHRSGDETIAGFKSFTEVLDRRNDVTTSTVATATQLVDTNANRCGWIANRMHWAGNYHVHNRHIAYNENSGKEVYIDIISTNNGSGGLFVGGSATNRNLNDVTSATDYTVLATMGWVNNPATSTNVVHRSGDETIAGTKTFSDITISNKELHYKDTTYDWTDTSIDTWCDAGHVEWYDKTGTRRMHELVGAQNGVWRKACYINESQYFSVDSNKNISYWGTSFKFNGKDVAGDGVDSWGGSWIRFKNGIQMCWGGGAHEEIISYPKAFRSPPALSCTPTSYKEYSLVVNYHLNTNTHFACSLWNIQTNTEQPKSYFTWIAIGFWKQ